MSRTWLSITVELVEGRDRTFWPRPGRVFGAARAHTFAELADAIDGAFARWDRAHLREFRLADNRRIGRPDPDAAEASAALDERTTKLSLLAARDRFLYVFDFGDGWHHLCTVAEHRIDPHETLGTMPDSPMPYFGWGELPDQYGRRFADDDLESVVPPNPRRRDLPPFFPWWGPGADRYPE
ncbi:MAG: IS1096 element passenger TnpR family protein [Acidimicrobiia bacterium]